MAEKDIGRPNIWIWKKSKVRKRKNERERGKMGTKGNPTLRIGNIGERQRKRKESETRGDVAKSALTSLVPPFHCHTHESSQVTRSSVLFFPLFPHLLLPVSSYSKISPVQRAMFLSIFIPFRFLFSQIFPCLKVVSPILYLFSQQFASDGK